MPKQNKFENVDVLASLHAILKQNTGFYQSDFDIDREIIARAAANASKGGQDPLMCFADRPGRIAFGSATYS